MHRDGEEGQFSGSRKGTELTEMSGAQGLTQGASLLGGSGCSVRHELWEEEEQGLAGGPWQSSPGGMPPSRRSRRKAR